MHPFICLKGSSDRIKSELLESISDIIDSSQFIGGGFLDECEKDLSIYTGRQTLCVSSGTDALLLALMALDLKPGEVVFVPSFTFAASAEVIALLGAVPYFVDVKKSDFNMCANSLKQAISEAKSQGMVVAGVISVDLFGQPADHDEICAIANDEGLWAINDAAQSFGALYKGSSTLKRGIISTTSFFPAKPLGCFGDGGAIFVDDPDLVEKIKSLRVHGQGAMRYTYQRVGINGRFDNIQAAVIVKKLKFFDDEIARRNTIAAKYNNALEEYVITPKIHNDRTSVFAQYTIRVQENKREDFRDLLHKAGIPSVIYYPLPIHLQPAYNHYPTTTMTNTLELCQTVMSLPMHPYMENHDDIISSVIGVAKECKLTRIQEEVYG